MEILKTKRLKNDQFYPLSQNKDQIFWHHTAGLSADGAINWWNQTPDHVGTAYVIDRDGKVYETFDPKCWGYHLGVKGDDDQIEKKSIGIEIVSGGQLYKNNDDFFFFPLYPNKAGFKQIDPKEVWEMEDEWRGFKYYHSYTDAQIESLIALTKQLIVDFKIKVQENFEGIEFYNFNDDIYKQHLQGIWSHSSVRNDKNDIVPYKPFLEKIYQAFGSPKPVIEENKEKENEVPKVDEVKVPILAPKNSNKFSRKKEG